MADQKCRWPICLLQNQHLKIKILTFFKDIINISRSTLKASNELVIDVENSGVQSKNNSSYMYFQQSSKFMHNDIDFEPY